VPDIEVFIGEVVPLSHNATDGNTGLYSRATIFNGNASPVPISAINLDHKSIGLYRANHAALPAGTYVAKYRFFTDVARTSLADYEQPSDTISVRDPVADGTIKEEPMLGVSYDDENNELLVHVFVLRNGQRALDSISAIVEIFDDDDNLIVTLTDDAPDGEGVFRMTTANFGISENELYAVTISIVTPERTVIGTKGFKVIA
jgi:hypothetical protein